MIEQEKDQLIAELRKEREEILKQRAAEDKAEQAKEKKEGK
jgi:hypothetical protein